MSGHGKEILQVESKKPYDIWIANTEYGHLYQCE